MSNATQYGHPVFIEGFKPGASSRRLTRIRLGKGVPHDMAYDEAWLQRLIMSQPGLLPVDQIEPAFADLIPVCIELQTASGGFLDNLLVTPTGDLALIE